MKQRNLFDLPNSSDVSNPEVNFWKLFVDGAARNNPGPAGVGIVILKNEKPIEHHGFFVGSKTNNQAEYLALLIGLLIIKPLLGPYDLLQILSDSELLVRHIKGIYKVKSPDLKPLYAVVQSLLAGIKYDIGHVLRYNNKQADALANCGIDQQKKVPYDLLITLQEYGISL